MMDNITIGNNLSYIDFPKPAKPDRYIEVIVETLAVTGNTFGATSIVLNLAFLFAVHFVKDRNTAYFRLIQNLAVADDLAALTFLITQNWPHGLFAYINPRDHFVLAHGLSYVFRGFPWMFFTAYLLTLSCLTLNQYVAVCKPWRYAQLVTPRVVTIAVIVIWCLSGLQLIIPLCIVLSLTRLSDTRIAMASLHSLSKIEIHFWMGFFVLAIFFNIILDVIVHYRIKQLQNKRRGTQRTIDSKNIETKQRAFVTLTLLLIASVFLRLPFPILGIVGLNLDYSMGAATVELVQAIVIFLLYINFLTDPIIYLVRTKEVTQTYRGLVTVCLRKCKRRSSQYPSSTSGKGGSRSRRFSCRRMTFEGTTATTLDQEGYRESVSIANEQEIICIQTKLLNPPTAESTGHPETIPLQPLASEN